MMFNFDTKNEELQNFLQKIKPEMPIDLDVGIKLRGNLIDAGFLPEKIQLNVQHMYFDTIEDRMNEAIQFRQRFANARSVLLEILKDEKKVDRFINLYLNEIENPRSLLFPQKVIVTATK